MAFDFSTLVTDRTQEDVAYVKLLLNKLIDGTATDEERAEWNSFTLKGAYNHTDLNRVTAAMEALKEKFETLGYVVAGYEKVKVPHVKPEIIVPDVPVALPAGYIQLTYIASTGKQYIDTGFKPNQDTRVVVDADFPKNGSTATWFFGTEVWETSARYQLRITSSETHYVSDYGTHSGITQVVPSGRMIFDKNKNVLPPT